MLARHKTDSPTIVLGLLCLHSAKPCVFAERVVFVKARYICIAQSLFLRENPLRCAAVKKKKKKKGHPLDRGPGGRNP